MIVLLVGVSMFVKDIFATGQIMLLAEGHPFLAGLSDALGDVAALLSYGVGGVAVYKHGVSLLSIGAVLAMGAGSVAGTLVGSALSHRLETARV